jgi:hypothetical protein
MRLNDEWWRYNGILLASMLDASAVPELRLLSATRGRKIVGGRASCHGWAGWTLAGPGRPRHNAGRFETAKLPLPACPDPVGPGSGADDKLFHRFDGRFRPTVGLVIVGGGRSEWYAPVLQERLEFGCSKWAVVSTDLYCPPPPVVHKECTERVDETPGGSVFDCEHGDGRPTTELVDYDQEVPAFHLAELVRGVAEVPPVKKEVVLRILRMRLRRGQYRSLCGAIER